MFGVLQNAVSLGSLDIRSATVHRFINPRDLARALGDLVRRMVERDGKRGTDVVRCCADSAEEEGVSDVQDETLVRFGKEVKQMLEDEVGRQDAGEVEAVSLCRWRAREYSLGVTTAISPST